MTKETSSKVRERKRHFRHERIRKVSFGTSARPRVCVHRSLNNLSAQIIDDASCKVLFGLSTLDKDLRKKTKTGGNVSSAQLLGEALAKKAMEKGIKKICFDRGGYVYHGRVKAFAEAMREAGLEF